jgi:hypothetical protein
MKVARNETGSHSTITCHNCAKRARLWIGHLHSNENPKRVADCGWCSYDCATKYFSKPCEDYAEGCYGKHRLRGWSK